MNCQDQSAAKKKINIKKITREVKKIVFCCANETSIHSFEQTKNRNFPPSTETIQTNENQPRKKKKKMHMQQ
jgi:hypothetical protein